MLRQQNATLQEFLGSHARSFLNAVLLTSNAALTITTEAAQPSSLIPRVLQEIQGLRSQMSRLEAPISENYFVLNDAIGRSFPIPLTTVISWRGFHVILSEQFLGHRGARRVARGNYALEDPTTQKEIRKSGEWALSFHPKQCVHMSVLCRSVIDADAALSSCPRCLKVSADCSGNSVKW